MSYKVKFLPSALKEWKKLAPPIKKQFKKKLIERSKSPHNRAVLFMPDTPNKPARFDRFLNKAESLIRSPERVQKLTAQALRKLTQQGADGLRQAQSQIQISIAIVNAWRTGEYRAVSKKTVVTLIAALLYFVVPLDVIPDLLLGWGFIDDMAVLGYVFNQLSGEIDDFKTWQTNSQTKQLTGSSSPNGPHPLT